MLFPQLPNLLPLLAQKLGTWLHWRTLKTMALQNAPSLLLVVPLALLVHSFGVADVLKALAGVAAVACLVALVGPLLKGSRSPKSLQPAIALGQRAIVACVVLAIGSLIGVVAVQAAQQMPAAPTSNPAAAPIAADWRVEARAFVVYAEGIGNDVDGAASAAHAELLHDLRELLRLDLSERFARCRGAFDSWRESTTQERLRRSRRLAELLDDFSADAIGRDQFVDGASQLLGSASRERLRRYLPVGNTVAGTEARDRRIALVDFVREQIAILAVPLRAFASPQPHLGFGTSTAGHGARRAPSPHGGGSTAVAPEAQPPVAPLAEPLAAAEAPGNIEPTFVLVWVVATEDTGNGPVVSVIAAAAAVAVQGTIVAATGDESLLAAAQSLAADSSAAPQHEKAAAEPVACLTLPAPVATCRGLE